jgi:hypothetical protein
MATNSPKTCPLAPDGRDHAWPPPWDKPVLEPAPIDPERSVVVASGPVDETVEGRGHGENRCRIPYPVSRIPYPVSRIPHPASRIPTGIVSGTPSVLVDVDGGPVRIGGVVEELEG